MKSIKDLKDLSNKKILLRLDLNVPIKNGKIIDCTRIDKILPTLNFLISKNSKIIILSHVGRPKGKIINELSLKPICENLKKKIKEDIKLISKDLRQINPGDLFKNPEEKIIMLENLRFYEEEEQNHDEFSKHLSTFADIYVNDAFSCSHRAHSSIDKITKFIKSYSGLQLDSEISSLKKITTEIKKPISCIIGGSKISTKINIIKNLIPKFNNIIIVGAMANNILEYKGKSVGKSLKEDNVKKIIDEIFQLSESQNCRIYYPEDVVVGKELNGTAKIKNLDEILDDDLILDIGPNTINTIRKVIDRSKTILWNGPAGYFENPNFAKGSKEIARAIIKKRKDGSIYSVVGGGDTISLINQIDSLKNFNFVSTAGGAFLEYLEGKELPGIKALK